MKNFVYADNAATTRLDPDALNAMLPYLSNAYGNPSQPYSFSRRTRRAVAEARECIAACIGASAEEIYFTSGGSESDNWAIKGTAFAASKEGALLTTAFEHHAVLNAAKSIECLGYPVSRMLPSTDGFITQDILKMHIGKHLHMVSVMMANNELGTIQPIRELCKIAHAHGALFHTDAVQAVGHIPIDVHTLGVDMLSASAHKFNGPRGIGFIYIRKGTKIAPLIDGGAQENRMRAGTENTAGIIGMATALQNNCANIDKNMLYIRSLEDKLLRSLDEFHVRYVRNGSEPRLPGLLSLAFPGFEGESILHRMDLLGIAISTGSACDSVNTEISHVLKAIRLDAGTAHGTIRSSLGKYNTPEDVERIAAALASIVAKKTG